MATMEAYRMNVSLGSSRSDLDALITRAHSFAAEHLNGKEDETHRAKLLISEVVANAVKHGNKFDPEKEIKVDISVCDQRVDIRVEDQGEGFDPQTIPNPLADEHRLREHGRGLHLIQSLADEVLFEQGGRRVCVAIHRV